MIACAATPQLADLTAALAQQRPDEIVVVGTVPAGFELPTGMRLIAAAGLSAAAARNRGAAAVTADVVIFVDADVLPAAGWLAALTAAHVRQPTALISATLRLDGDGYWRRCDHRLAYAPILAGQHAVPRWLPAMSLLVPATLWRQLGGFDETYRGAAGEDLDFCRRAQRHGAALDVAADAGVQHNAARHRAADIWQHQHRFGVVQARLDGDDARRQRTARLMRRLRVLWPLIALGDAMVRQLRTPGGRPWDIIGLYWGRLAWYDGRYSG